MCTCVPAIVAKVDLLNLTSNVNWGDSNATIYQVPSDGDYRITTSVLHGMSGPGIDIYIASEVPTALGWSSSATVLVNGFNGTTALVRIPSGYYITMTASNGGVYPFSIEVIVEQL